MKKKQSFLARIEVKNKNCRTKNVAKNWSGIEILEKQNAGAINSVAAHGWQNRDGISIKPLRDFAVLKIESIPAGFSFYLFVFFLGPKWDTPALQRTPPLRGKVEAFKCARCWCLAKQPIRVALCARLACVWVAAVGHREPSSVTSVVRPAAAGRATSQQ